MGREFRSVNCDCTCVPCLSCFSIASLAAMFFSTVFLIAALVVTACTEKPGNGDNRPASAAAKSELTIGLVLDKGGRDDRSFNSAAVAGTERARKEFGVKIKDVESPDDTAFEPALRTFAERGLPLVVAIGFGQADALKKVAPQFPNTRFAIVDAVVDGPNIASLMFEEQEGSYLVGHLAGMATKTGTVGFIGGMDVALIRRFMMAYEAGVKAANPKARVLSNFVGITAAAWANPARGKELTLAQINQGADIVFHAAGASGMGVFDAVEEKSTANRSMANAVYAIGVDSNQNALKPGRILTSMLKRVDTAVYTVISEIVKGSFKAGRRSFGLKDGGIDIAIDSNNEKLIAPYRSKLDEVRGKIISGAIAVPDYYKLRSGK